MRCNFNEFASHLRENDTLSISEKGLLIELMSCSMDGKFTLETVVKDKPLDDNIAVFSALSTLIKKGYLEVESFVSDDGKLNVSVSIDTLKGAHFIDGNYYEEVPNIVKCEGGYYIEDDYGRVQ